MNSSMRSGRENGLFAATIALAALIGIFLRCYFLKDDVFGDDEWHGLYFAIGRSPVWLLTHFSIPGATCIPLNFYTGILGATAGWSETLLRLPSVIFGVLCVIICPFVARQVIGTRQAAWLALLLAISPVLIFYSRIARPYSAVAFFGFLCILSAARWWQSGEKFWGCLYVASATLAIYFHLFAIVTAMAPALTAVIYDLFIRFSQTQKDVPIVRAGHWIVAAGAVLVFSGFLMAPAVIHLLETKFHSVAFAGTLKAAALPRAAMLLDGTAQPILMFLFFAALTAGAICLWRRNAWLGGMLIGIFPMHAAALLLSRPDSAQSAVVLLRYSIPVVPVGLLLAACGIQAALDAIADRVDFSAALQWVTVFAFAAALALAGPLPQCYVAPNNFTTHGAFQHNYQRIDWSHSFRSDFMPAALAINTVIQESEISPFYKALGQHPDGRSIVEYPMMIGDHFNPFYYYQHFHHRPVLVGYAMDVVLPLGLSEGNIYGDTYIDQVLSLVHDPSRLRFRNLVSMDDLGAMRARNVEFIVLHKRFEAQLDSVALALPDIARLYKKYHDQIGAPVYEDAHLAVFQLN